MRRLARLLCTAILLVSIPAISNAQQPATWRLVEEWRVGGEPDGPHSFDALFGFARLPNGNLVHFDYKTEQLHFLDAKGTPLKSVGRKGSGPGETRLANGFAVMPNGRIVMNDRGNSRFVIRDS